jgi:hypothetical protein
MLSPTRLAAVLVVAALPLFAGAGLAATGSRPQLPPNGVYTCAWIGSHPAAAAEARVTCDPTVFFSASLGASNDAMSPLSSGCQVLPTSGAVGKGVWAWTAYRYSHYFAFAGINSFPNYTWYVQNTGGTVDWGNIADQSFHNSSVLPFNNYRWGAQNHSEQAQKWNVCWYD